METLFVHWNPNPVALNLGFMAIRWYSLCWVLALLSAYWVVQRLYRRQGIGDEKFEPLFMYCFVGIIVGARLGHCLFYEPEYYIHHIMEMLLPFRGGRFTGYEGLASHGGTLGLMLALWLYNRRYQVGVRTILDNIAIATPIAAFFIRMGNLMNSEIIGRPTDLPWAFIFERVDMLPRHPGQLYEALTYLLLFFIGLCIYHRSSNVQYSQTPNKLLPQVGTGWYFGWCIFAIFSSRILIEYTKEVQEAFEQGMLFNMGQMLSVPFVLLGSYCMYKAWQRKN